MKSFTRNRLTDALIALTSLFFALLHQQIHGQVAARVGSYEITAGHLAEEIELISELPEYQDLGYLDRREIALEKLINNQLLFNYALESNIEVTDREVEQYFIAQYGDHPNLQTNGVFDQQKFESLKRNYEIRKLFRDLHRELLIHKTETILRNRFRYNDNMLMQRYLLENTKIDISYALISEETVNLPIFVHPEELMDYYRSNRRLFSTPTKAEIRFFIVPFEQFELEIEPIKTGIDTTLLESQDTGEIGNIVKHEDWKRLKVAELVRSEAELSTSRLINGLTIDYPLLNTEIYFEPYQESNYQNLFVNLDLVSKVRDADVSKYSEPIETDYGYLVFQVENVVTYRDSLTFQEASLVRQNYIQYVAKNKFRSQLEQHYRNNINDLIVPAVHVTAFIIDKKAVKKNTHLSAREMRSFYERNRLSFPAEIEKATYAELQSLIMEKYIDSHIQVLRDWCEENLYLAGYDIRPTESVVSKNGVEVSNQLIFLEKFANDTAFGDVIRAYILAEPNVQTGSFEQADFVLYYRINSFFPAYIPNYYDIENYLFEQAGLSLEKNDDVYYEYYNKHKSSFTSPDSLNLAGLFVSVRPDTVEVKQDELRELYLTRQHSLYSDHRVVLDYLFIPDPDVRRRDFCRKLANRLKQDVSISLLQFSFGQELPLPRNEPIALKALPLELGDLVSSIPQGRFSEPMYYSDAWIIVQKINDIPSQQLSFNEVKDHLSLELRRAKAEEYARKVATQLFIEVNRVREVYEVADSTMVFQTGLLSVNDDFGPLGDLGVFKQRIMQLRRNEKLNTVYSNENGFGVVFLLEKKPGEQLDFEEVLPLVSRSYDKEKRVENAVNFVTQLRELIVNGYDPETVLTFWGGWHRQVNLSLNSTIPRLEHSALIIENAVNRNIGEVSHVIRNGDNEYFFYRLDSKQQAGVESFRQARERFRESVLEADYKKWLSEYGQRIIIEKY